MMPSSSNSAKESHTELNPESFTSAGTSLTRREWLGALGLGLVTTGVAAGITLLAVKRSRVLSGTVDTPRRLIPFHLTERSGRMITLADLSRKILVVNFIFTSCSLSCRVVNNRMEEIQNLTRTADDVQLLSLTVDPRSDTPSVLAKFADGYHADPSHWLFLTGDKSELYRLIETSFLPKSREMEEIIPGGFIQTERIILVDRSGRVHTSFNGLDRHVATAVVAEIETIRRRS